MIVAVTRCWILIASPKRSAPITKTVGSSIEPATADRAAPTAGAAVRRPEPSDAELAVCEAIRELVT